MRTDADILAHLGDDYERYDGAVISPIFMTSLHVTPKDKVDGDTSGRYHYGRVSNPTTALFEQKLAALERADGALAFASGMAAISTTLNAVLQSGDHVVCVDQAYGPTRAYLSDVLGKRFGVESAFVNGEDTAALLGAVKDNTRVIYLESPTSMHFRLQDLKAIAAFAKPRGIITMIDNSWATPLYQKPLTMGIDVSLHTVSKYIGGHSDVVAGAAAANEPLLTQVRRARELYGGILQPMEAWLCIRGLRSLAVRLDAHARAGQEIARRLEAHPKVARVNHPALSSHPQHELAKTQMTGAASPLSFELAASPEAARAFVKRLQWFNVGPSWGGFESMVTLPPPDAPIVRIHVGLEDVETLWGDLRDSLDQVE